MLFVLQLPAIDYQLFRYSLTTSICLSITSPVERDVYPLALLAFHSEFSKIGFLRGISSTLSEHIDKHLK